MLTPAPPSILPLTLPAEANLKVSAPVPPVRLAMPEKVTLPTVPALGPVRFHVSATLGPASVLMPLPPLMVVATPVHVPLRMYLSAP